MRENALKKKGKYIEMKLNNQNKGKRKRKIENEKDAYR